ncbi:MAG: hypothetical protein ACRELD_05275 [Longimicrobiales bacterium]
MKRSSLWRLSAIVVGILPAAASYLLVFPDPRLPLAAELAWRMGAVVLMYLAFGAVFGFLRPGRGWEWGLEIGVPAMVILGFVAPMSLRYDVLSGFAIALSALALALIGGCAGGALGSRLALRRDPAAAGR